MRKRRQKVPREKTEAKGRRKKKKKKSTPTGSRIQAFTSLRRPGRGASPGRSGETSRAGVWKGDMLNHYTIGAGGRAGGAGPEANP